MLNQIAAAKAKKDESAGDKIASSWAVVCKGFEADRDSRSRYRKAKEYLTKKYLGTGPWEALSKMMGTALKVAA